MALPNIVRVAFALALPDAGLIQFRPGDNVQALHYSTRDYAVFQGYATANPGEVIEDDATNIDAAVVAVEVLRLRGGDPVGEYQASQSLLDAAYIADYPQ
jgi:hypothetical protein